MRDVHYQRAKWSLVHKHTDTYRCKKFIIIVRLLQIPVQMLLPVLTGRLLDC